MGLKGVTGAIVVGLLAVGLESLVRVTDTPFYLTQLTMAAYYSLAALGLALLTGHAGQVSLAHAGFFAAGGYVSAVLVTRDLTPYAASGPVQWLDRLHLLSQRADAFGSMMLHVAPWPALLAALTVTALLAALIGVPVLRLRGHYLAMATLGAGSIIYQLVLGTRLFGEADGLSDVPPFPVLPGLEICGARSGRVGNYYVACGLLVLTLLLFANLMRSRAGRALRAIHGNEEAAAAMGIDTARAKLGVFVLSAVMAALAGALLTHYNGGIGPSEASVLKSVRYLAIVAVGGMSRFLGVTLASVALNFLSLRGYFGSYDDAVFGLILVAVMLFAPEGVGRIPLPFVRRRP
ncbi:MAG: branched-chain amino acid ABC transporter permease [Vicinamibacteria bacterium]|nr:branched-chain amino acid ABC transporter permease [Vicinamibacteria bacterium]